MTTNSLLAINLLSPVLFYQNPIDIYDTQTGSTQMTGTPCEMKSCRGCNNNLAGNDPASQYQRQKLIQNTVRVKSSLYTMNLAGLSSYEKPSNTPQLVEQSGTSYVVPAKVYWNQMSDRARPSNQLAKVASGSTYHTSSTRHTITRNRPGAMSPGGIGVDIKHNSYNRYLNKLKGKGPLKRGIIPPNYGADIPFNRAYPIYGGKIIKTGLINGCDCPDSQGNKYVFNSSLNNIQDNIMAVRYKYNVGDFVWAKKYKNDTILNKGQITNISDELYTVKFEDDVTSILTYCDLFIYFDCNCQPSLSTIEQLFVDFPHQRQVASKFTSSDNIYCNVLNKIATDIIIL